MKKILFICLGNICRSAAAEAVMKKLIDDEDLSKDFFIDSAGTIDYHKGEKADSRMISHAAKRGYDITSISRPITQQDYYDFDYIIVMDENNFKNVSNLCPEDKLINKIIYMSEFFTKHNDKVVPDPYFGGEKGFEYVLDLLEDGCKEVISQLIK
ncbi:MAG: low molecular weight protein-tyrosine-phosphatase [Bacteroidales bacterium]|nr:low molecular weight phosphotyrosine protein phosphatase [Bacteroidales bacterium]